MNIKTQRVKQYFIEATKKIIYEEGIEGVSIRKVAEQAGYAFTTIYNYFKDLKTLLYEVKLSMFQDIIDHMTIVMPGKIHNIQDIKTINRYYIQYFVERPHVFTFFYSYRLQPSGDSIEMPDFSHIYLQTYQSLVDKGIIHPSEVGIMARTIIYSIQGLLTLYFSDNGMTQEILYDELDSVLDYLLKSK